ncbi:MAG: InlB B-repeat-containing protein [Lachnospiraceae bacterium]|nr:InlB B-repeat-containing protein [Lachnospiraceae bacterium]
MQIKRVTVLAGVMLSLCLAFPGQVKASGDVSEMTFVEVDPKEASGHMASDYFGEEDALDAVGASLEKYGSDYIYDQLTTAEQKLWDDLDDICTEWYSSSDNISKVSSTSGTEYYPLGYVEYTGLSTDAAKKVSNLFKYSRPQYYYLNTNVLFYYYPGTSNGGVSMTAYEGFAKGSDRKTANSKVEKKLSAWNKTVAKASGTVAKEKAAHDVIAQNTKYTTGADYNQSCYSVLVNGKSVCTGYATTFSMLMNYAGIDTINVTSAYHEWNMTCVDNTWYNVDVTFDDPVTTSGKDIIRYNYFNRSDSKIKENDTSYKEHTRESLWSKYAPSSSKDSGASTDSVGSVSDSSSAQSYTVTLDANGGYIGKSSTKKTTVSVNYGEKYATLVDPAKAGSTFAGWYTKKSGGSKVTKSTKVSTKKNHTLYAHWTKISVGKSKITKVTNVSGKKVKVQFKKVSKTDGYEVSYSLKSNMSSAKAKTTSKTSYTISGLKKGKTYYIRVRAYKKDSAGKKVYGKYTSVKKIKVTK